MFTKIFKYLKSKTILGILGMISPTVSGLLGFDLGAELSLVIEALGTLLAVYGRVRAQIKIDSLKAIVDSVAK